MTRTPEKDLAFIDSIFAKFQAWREEEIILEDGRKLGQAIAPFQRERFDAWDTKSRIYCETCTDSSKTTDVAAWTLSMLRFLSGWEALIFAVDRDQARLIIGAAEGMLRRNRKLKTNFGLEVQRNKIISTVSGGSCRIESSDTASAEGILADCVICEQLESWPKEELWESIYSRAHKREMRVIIIANAPQTEDMWQWRIRDWAQNDPLWTWLEAVADDVPWITSGKLEDERRGLREARFMRLYYNVIGNADESLFTPAQAEAMCVLDGPVDEVPEGIRRAVLGLDMGLYHDLAALACVGERMDGSQDLLNMKVWQGGPNKPVLFTDVEGPILDWMKRYKAMKLIFDPWQFERSAQTLKLMRTPVEKFIFSSKSVNDLTNQLWRRGVDGLLRIYPGAGALEREGSGMWDLAREMRSVKMVEGPLGYKLENKGKGTKDRLIALGMASLWLTQ